MIDWIEGIYWYIILTEQLLQFLTDWIRAFSKCLLLVNIVDNDYLEMLTQELQAFKGVRSYYKIRQRIFRFTIFLKERTNKISNDSLEGYQQYWSIHKQHSSTEEFPLCS